MWTRGTVQGLVSAATLLLAIAAQGQSVWNSTNGTWNSNGAGNEWTPNGVPTSSTVVHFGSTAVVPTTVTATVKGKSVVSASAIIGVDSGRTATVIVEDQGSPGVWTASGDIYVAWLAPEP